MDLFSWSIGRSAVDNRRPQANSDTNVDGVNTRTAILPIFPPRQNKKLRDTVTIETVTKYSAPLRTGRGGLRTTDNGREFVAVVSETFHMHRCGIGTICTPFARGDRATFKPVWPWARFKSRRPMWRVSQEASCFFWGGISPFQSFSP